MADEPKKVIVQPGRVDITTLPDSFSLPYKLYVIQQTTDMKNVADASNNANDLAYQATIKNNEQDVTLADHESRISGLRVEVDDHEVRIVANKAAIDAIDVRVTTAEGKIIGLTNSVNAISADMVSKTATSNQNVQASGGSFLVGSIPSPTTDKLQTSDSVNALVSYKVSGIQVIGARRTGWTSAVGTAYRGGFNSDANWAVSNPPTQGEVQNIVTGLIEVRRRLKAVEEDLRAHGVING